MEQADEAPARRRGAAGDPQEQDKRASITTSGRETPRWQGGRGSGAGPGGWRQLVEPRRSTRGVAGGERTYAPRADSSSRRQTKMVQARVSPRRPQGRWDLQTRPPAPVQHLRELLLLLLDRIDLCRACNDAPAGHRRPGRGRRAGRPFPGLAEARGRHGWPSSRSDHGHCRSRKRKERLRARAGTSQRTSRPGRLRKVERRIYVSWALLDAVKRQGLAAGGRGGLPSGVGIRARGRASGRGPGSQWGSHRWPIPARVPLSIAPVSTTTPQRP